MPPNTINDLLAQLNQLAGRRNDPELIILAQQFNELHGDIVGGSKFTVGDITNSSAVTIGHTIEQLHIQLQEVTLPPNLTASLISLLEEWLAESETSILNAARRALNSLDQQERFQGIQALVALNNRDARSLLTTARESQFRDVRVHATYTLAIHFSDPVVVEPILRVWTHFDQFIAETSPLTYQHLCTFYGYDHLQRRVHRAVILQLLTVRAISHTAQPAGRPILLEALQSSWASIRIQALEGLIMLNDQSVIPYIKPLTNDVNKEVQHIAQQALHHLTSHRQ